MTAIDLKDVKIRMKPPLSYYGGKQKLSRDICRALYQSPNWSLKGRYIEPYFGGGAVFFAKEPQKMETINDLNDNLITFYLVVKDPAGFERLKALLDGTLYSRSEFNKAGRILKGEIEASVEERAWAVFVKINLSFANGWSKTMSYAVASSKDRKGLKLQAKIARLTIDYCERLKNALIESDDALNIIRLRDSPVALFYIDPPYVGADQTGYGGFSFSDDNLLALLGKLKELKGFFLLSMHPNAMIEEAAKECGWQIAKKPYACKVYFGERNAKDLPRTECLIANYPFYLDGWEVAQPYSGAACPLPQEAREELQLELMG